jgi:hydrogenase nickel incorporation protein HypB
MVQRVLKELDPSEFDLLVLENVGNLVCPAEFDTGAGADVMILSVPEGDDKPRKYPLMFATSDVVILNKTDYLPVSDFDRDAFLESVRKLNRDAPVFELSCRTGAGVDSWIGWLRERLRSTHKCSV